MATSKLTWKDVVADTLQELGGEAHLSDINAKIDGHPKTKTNPTWKDTIRRVVRQYKIFEPVPPDRSGIYKLMESPHTTDPKSQELTETDDEMNHGIVQGMLVTLGNVYGYETFVPATDQTIREFQEKKLGDLVTVGNCNNIFNGPNLPKIREIDVIWFDEDDYGLYPVYAFEVEHTTKVKSGLDRLLKIPKRYSVELFIVAPGDDEQKLFNRYLSQTPFKGYQDRFQFRRYLELQNIFNAAIEHEQARKIFGVKERREWY